MKRWYALYVSLCSYFLTHWGRVTHISKLTIICADNGLSPGRRQAIIWTNAGILLVGPLGTNVNEISIELHTFLFKKFHLKMSSGKCKCRPFCLGLNVLNMHINWPWKYGNPESLQTFHSKYKTLTNQNLIKEANTTRKLRSLISYTISV